jgi:NhaP-type Na+/H+ or K+/H+ antiporter
MQVLLLAGPGVVIGTALTAVFVKYVFPYNWTWLESLLFGAMLSATDPVAVIALLQEVCETSSCVCIHGCYLSCW